MDLFPLGFLIESIFESVIFVFIYPLANPHKTVLIRNPTDDVSWIFSDPFARSGIEIEKLEIEKLFTLVSVLDEDPVWGVRHEVVDLHIITGLYGAQASVYREHFGRDSELLGKNNDLIWTDPIVVINLVSSLCFYAAAFSCFKIVAEQGSLTVIPNEGKRVVPR